MNFRNWLLCFSKSDRQMEQKRYSLFLENGSKLLKGLVASSDGRYGVPYRNFTAEELIRATTNFKDRVMSDGSGHFYRGSFRERSILVKRCCFIPNDDSFSNAINDIVISLQMSHHKNVFKLLGCCLEFEAPALVYEYDSSNTRLLSDTLYYHDKNTELAKDADSSLSWRVRLKLAVDIANALVYLHTTFATPVIHRGLCPRNIVICSDGVAKLLDFSLCISLPPGESQVEDVAVGLRGIVEPEYISSGLVTEKTDVYMFGVLLLQLLNGERLSDICRKVNDLLADQFVVDYVEDHFVNNKIDEILDPILLAEKAGNQQEYDQQMQAVAELAVRCTREREGRPDMITVAKELVQINKSVHFP